MHRVILLPLLGAVAFIVYQLIAFVLRYQKRAVKAREWGCKRAALWDRSDIFGYKNVKSLLKADSEKRMVDSQIERFQHMSEREGRICSTFEIIVPPGKSAWVTCEPENVKALLATQFKDFGLPRLRILGFIPMLGQGIFATNGHRWENSRALLRPQFVRDQVSDLDLEERHVQNLLKALRTGQDGWTDRTDLQVLFFRLTMDSATEFLFGESVDSQLDGLPGSKNQTSHQEKAFAYAFDRGQMYLAKGGRMGEFYWIAYNKDFREQCRICNEFIDYFVQRALNVKSKGKADDKKKYVFLEQLAEATQDPVQIRTELINILLAGRDTTASLLGYLFVLLAQHPEEFNKLRAKIIEDFGTFDASKPITFSGLKNCSYLQWALNETLRCYPVVPLNGRAAYHDTTLPVGGGPDGKSPIFIPAGGEVLYSVHVMHHRKDLWGEDADVWKPERWQSRRPGWEYLPFNGGPRICIGQQFALTEAGYVTVRLLQKYDKIDASAIPKDLKHGLTLTSCPADGVNVRMHVAPQ